MSGVIGVGELRLLPRRDARTVQTKAVVELLEDALAHAKAGEFLSVWLTAETVDGDVAVMDVGAEMDASLRGARLMQAGMDVMIRHRLTQEFRPMGDPAPEG